MIERVAQAIKENGGDKWADWRYYEPQARAAIAAMREPTGEMIQASIRATGGFPKTAWHAMIDAALVPKATK